MNSSSSTSSGKTRPYLTCREMLDFVMAYLDNELDPVQREDFERHLKVCPSCVNYLASYKLTVQLGKSAMHDSNDPADTVAPRGLVEAIQAARRASNQ